jgi:hypothetical protein
MFGETLAEDGWIETNSLGNRWAKNALNCEITVSLFESSDSTDGGCILIEATCEATNDFYSATAGTACGGFPNINIEGPDCRASDFIRQVFSSLNKGVKSGCPVDFNEENAARIADTLHYFDETTVDEWETA